MLGGDAALAWHAPGVSYALLTSGAAFPFVLERLSNTAVRPPDLSRALEAIGRPCVEMALDGVPECCLGARARRERQRDWYGRRGIPPGACHAKAASSASHVGTPSEHPRIACSLTASHGSQIGRGCVELALEGVPECCSGARARRERQRHWYGRRGVPPGASHAKDASCGHPE